MEILIEIHKKKFFYFNRESFGHTYRNFVLENYYGPSIFISIKILFLLNGLTDFSQNMRAR